MSRRFGRTVRTVCTLSLAAAAVALPPTGAAADPSVAELLTRLQTLYVKAEEATEAYNDTEAKLDKQQARTERLNRELARVRRALAGHRARAALLAGQQYRGGAGGLSDSVHTLLSGDLRRVADERHELRRAADRQALIIGRLERGERRADAVAARADAALDKRRDLADERREQHEKVTGRLADIERALASLSTDQLAALRKREKRETAAAQRTLLSTRALAAPERRPSKKGARALRYAMRQIGKPYAWGAEGPDAFDCSGLTQQAWLRAGHIIPRTSQEQWRTVPRVPLSELRPGDVVVYYPKATHVALYAGDGVMVEAPRPGNRVRMAPLATYPIRGVVRPDAAPPLPDTGKPAADPGMPVPVPEKPSLEKPAPEKPVSEKPAQDKPAPENPAPDKPAPEKPAPDKPEPAKVPDPAKPLPAPGEPPAAPAPALKVRTGRR
ncbi:NlpC/P60 family protein [Streptomyces sp. P1-3]|uniref:C40 family peptidase n=1 Tax=Streptomyces sp. P1-3 TaxID=3421658 RepID=UPI003D35BE09